MSAFDQVAWQYFVYPLDNRDRLEKFADLPPAALAAANRPRIFWPGAQTTPRSDIYPLLSARSYRITVRVAHRAIDQGILWAIGDPAGGMVLYVEEGRLGFHYNGYGDTTDLPSVALPTGAQEVTLDYEAIRGREGRGRLLIGNREAVGWTPMSPTMALIGVFERLDVGLDRRGPVLWGLYERHGSFPYTGEIRDVTVTPGARVPDRNFAT